MDKAALEGRNEYTGAYEEFEAIWAERAARLPADAEDARHLTRRAEDREPFEDYTRRVRQGLRQLAGIDLLETVERAARFTEAGEYAEPLSGVAFDTVGRKDGYTVYMPMAYLHFRVPPNVRLTKDRPLGTGMFAAEVWALAGSPFLLWVEDTGTFRVKPAGHAGWHRLISWAAVKEYFTPLPIEGIG